MLEALAERHELTPPITTDAVETDYQEGGRRGVLESPHFFIDGAGTFCPSLDISRPDAQLHIECGQTAFNAFDHEQFAT